MQLKKISVIMHCIALLLLSACTQQVPGRVPQRESHKTAAYYQRGNASFYGEGFHGKKTASGERFDKNKLTAAHRSLPFGTMLQVTCPETNKSVRVRINDRGPFIPGRIIDLSEQAARQLGIKQDGIAVVELRMIEDRVASVN